MTAVGNKSARNGRDIYPMPRPIAVRKIVVEALVGTMPNDQFVRTIVRLMPALAPHLRVEPVMRSLVHVNIGELLTNRDIQILALIADGHTNAEIGETIYLSEESVKFEMRRILRTLGVSNRAAAVAAAIRRGLIP